MPIQGIDQKTIYDTIREEILDQKRCQFQFFSTAVTATAIILAYGIATHVTPIVYLAPIVMNTAALIIILDKAVSYQRKVGYLQMMERYGDKYVWWWETQLDSFRLYSFQKESPQPIITADPPRKYSYVTTLSLFLIGLNILSAILSACPTDTPGINPCLSHYGTWVLPIISALFVLLGIVYFLRRRWQFINGPHSGIAIYQTWTKVLENYKTSPAPPIQT